MRAKEREEVITPRKEVGCHLGTENLFQGKADSRAAFPAYVSFSPTKEEAAMIVEVMTGDNEEKYRQQVIEQKAEKSFSDNTGFAWREGEGQQQFFHLKRVLPVR